MKGTGSDNQRSAVNISDEAVEEASDKSLADQVYLSRATVENWKRFTNNQDDLINARFSLLDNIREQGKFSLTPPEWMTSPKPGTDAYLFLEDKVVLLLTKDLELSQNKGYFAKNCVAPKRGRKGKNTQVIVDNTQTWSGEELEILNNKSVSQIVDKLWISLHAIERYQERVEEQGDESTLRELCGEAILSKAPAWADAAGHEGWGLVVETSEDTLCFPLLRDRTEREEEYVITTCLSKKIIEQEIDSLKDAEKRLSSVEISSRLLKKIKSENFLEEFKNAPLEMVSADKSGPWIILEEGKIRLRPASASQRREGKLWVALKIEQL